MVKKYSIAFLDANALQCKKCIGPCLIALAEAVGSISKIHGRPIFNNNSQFWRIGFIDAWKLKVKLGQNFSIKFNVILYTKI